MSCRVIFLDLGTNNIWGHINSLLGWGGIFCIIQCVAEYLSSTYYMTIAHILPTVTTKNVSRCSQISKLKSHLVENHHNIYTCHSLTSKSKCMILLTDGPEQCSMKCQDDQGHCRCTVNVHCCPCHIKVNNRFSLSMGKKHCQITSYIQSLRMYIHLHHLM